MKLLSLLIKSFGCLLIVIFIASCSTAKSTKTKGVSLEGACYLYDKCFFLGTPNLASPHDKPKTVTNPDIQALPLWHHQVGNGGGDAGLKLKPVKNNRFMVAASNDGKLIKFELSSGKILWSVSSGQNISSGITVSSNIVIIGTAEGMLEAYDFNSGKLAWKQQLSSVVLSRPAVISGVVGVRTADGQVSGLSISSGEKLWKSSVGMPALSIRAQSDLVSLGDTFIVPTSKGRIVGFRARSGKKVIDAPIVLGKGKTEISKMSDFSATPAILGNVIFLSAYGQKTLAINLQSDNPKLWESDISTSKDIFIDDKFLYLITDDSEIFALSPRNGKTVWKNKQFSGRKLSPIDGNGLLLTVRDLDGFIYLLDRNTGKIKGEINTSSGGSNVTSSFFKLNQFLTFSDSGKLSVYKINSPSFDKLSKKTSKPVSSNPKNRYSFTKSNRLPAESKKRSKKLTPLSFPSN